MPHCFRVITRPRGRSQGHGHGIRSAALRERTVSACTQPLFIVPGEEKDALYSLSLMEDSHPDVLSVVAIKRFRYCGLWERDSIFSRREGESYGLLHEGFSRSGRTCDPFITVLLDTDSRLCTLQRTSWISALKAFAEDHSPCPHCVTGAVITAITPESHPGGSTLTHPGQRTERGASHCSWWPCCFCHRYEVGEVSCPHS